MGWGLLLSLYRLAIAKCGGGKQQAELLGLCSQFAFEYGKFLPPLVFFELKCPIVWLVAGKVRVSKPEKVSSETLHFFTPFGAFYGSASLFGNRVLRPSSLGEVLLHGGCAPDASYPLQEPWVREQS